MYAYAWSLLSIDRRLTKKKEKTSLNPFCTHIIIMCAHIFIYLFVAKREIEKKNGVHGQGI